MGTNTAVKRGARAHLPPNVSSFRNPSLSSKKLKQLLKSKALYVAYA